jgi:hypothetical protein
MSKNDIKKEEFKLKNKDKEIKKLKLWDIILFKAVILVTILMFGLSIIITLLRG